MSDKTCPKCGEAVGHTKAFCPSCGHAFVDEQERAASSAYDAADHTQQLGQTMYNNLLSDMGLNVNKPQPEKRVEVLKPVGSATQVLEPAAPKTESVATPPEKKSNTKVWIITAAVAGALLLILVAAVVLVGIYLYFRSGRL